MSETINKIVIVGGGSAGWMSASFLVKAFPNKEIVLIESPDYPIVGVGESTIGGITAYCAFLGIDLADFLLHTDGSLKLSIKFTDFYEKDGGGFHYPFGKPYLEGTFDGLKDWYYLKSFYGDQIPVEDFVLSYFPASALYENNKYSPNTYKQFDNFDPRTDVALHFDATKFGQWLKNNYSIPRGVKHISATVVDVVVSESGVDYLVLDNGEKVTSDLFVDATGWKSLLLGDALKVPFQPYSDLLPNNKAWATRVQYIDKELELEPFTNCTALGNGWCWNIPLWSRLGTGYVFSDNFTTEEDALEEFKNYLCSDKMVIPRTREVVDKLEYKLIDMRVGVHEKIWEKNVVAIGLSAGFIEPLESNGLYTVHEYLFALVKAMTRKVVTQIDKDFFNYNCINLYGSFAEFVAQHYKLSIRDDTEYWRAVTKKSIYEHLKTSENKAVSSFNAQYSYKYTSLTPSVMAGLNYISVGMHHLMMDDVDIFRAMHYESSIPVSELENIYFPRLEAKKRKWAMAAYHELSLYEYLKENYHQGHDGDVDNG